MTRPHRVLRGVRLVLGLLVAGSLLGPAASSDAQDAPPTTLGGFQGTAAASGVHVFYNPEGLLPLPPPVDVGAPDALSTIASGPQTYARSSVLDPGDLLANPDAILAVASAAYPAGTLPAYPFRISAQSGFGAPVAESNPAPGLNARVSATDTGSTAQATTPAINVPAIATVGSMSATTTTHTDGATVTVTSHSQIAGFNLLGLVTIDSVVTELSATSDGTETTFSGGTQVVGASLFGVPVSIDADGIHQAPGTPPLLQGVLGPLVSSLNEVLVNAGIRITVAGPVEVAGEAAGRRGSDGLKIDLSLSPQNVPALADLLESLPPIENPLPGAPSIEDLLFAAQTRQLAAIQLARGLVVLEARPGATFDATVPSAGGTLPGFSPSVPTFDLPTTPVPSAPLAPSSPTGTSEEPYIPAGVGVGGLVLLALLASPFVGDLLGRLSMAVLAADGTTPCTWEER